MRIINKTDIDNLIIQNIAHRAGIATTNDIVTVKYDKTLGPMISGQCSIVKDGQYTIHIRDNYDIPTLAHELKHLYYTLKGNKVNTGGEERSCKLFEKRYNWTEKLEK